MKHLLNAGTLLVLLALITVGCATSGGASNEEQINALLGDWKAAILAIDLDDFMATYSANFAHDDYDYEAEDYAGLREYIETSMDEGGFDDVEVILEDMEIEIEDETAAVYPIDYVTPEGTLTIELTLTKEKAGWLITDMMLEGL
jgi:hypothetical protein